MDVFGKGYTDKQIMGDFVRSVKSAGLKGIVLKGGLNLERTLQERGITQFRTTIDIDLHLSSRTDWNMLIREIPLSVSANSPLGIRYEVVEVRGDKFPSSDTALIRPSKGSNFWVDMNVAKRVVTVTHSDGYLDGYSIGSMVADKTLVFFSKKVYRRSKDLYDLYLLSLIEDYNLEEIVKDVKVKWQRKPPELPLHFADLDKLGHAYGKLKGLESDFPFSKIYDRVLSFCSGIWGGMYKGYTGLVWDKERGEWRC